MPTIIERLRDDALGLMSLQDISHGQTSLPARIISDANRAKDEIAAFVDDTFHYEEERGVYIHERISQSVTVTKGSLVISDLAPSPADWMDGCTCLIQGAPTYNRVRKDAAGVFTLLSRPYIGESGTNQKLQVWHDSVRLPSDVLRVKQPLFYNQTMPLQVTDARTLRMLISDDTRLAGIPDIVAEITVPNGDDAPSLALLLNQLPAGGAEIKYTAVIKIANFTSLSDTRTSMTPFELDDSVLLPIFRFYFASYPGCELNKGEMMEEYARAKLSLERIGKQSAAPKRLRRPARGNRGPMCDPTGTRYSRAV